MKTPYDAPLRVAERELDDVRTAIGVALGELRDIEDATAALHDTMAREAAAAAGDRSLASERFFLRAREQRAQLAVAHHAADQRVEALRARAIECYGTRTAIGNAAARYREEAERAAAAAEQAALDDIAAARLVRSQRRRPMPVPLPTRAAS
jgi:flagellar biosynthesis chaperone FliJ